MAATVEATSQFLNALTQSAGALREADMQSRALNLKKVEMLQEVRQRDLDRDWEQKKFRGMSAADVARVKYETEKNRLEGDRNELLKGQIEFEQNKAIAKELQEKTDGVMKNILFYGPAISKEQRPQMKESVRAELKAYGAPQSQIDIALSAIDDPSAFLWAGTDPASRIISTALREAQSGDKKAISFYAQVNQITEVNTLARMLYQARLDEVKAYDRALQYTPDLVEDKRPPILSLNECINLAMDALKVPYKSVLNPEKVEVPPPGEDEEKKKHEEAAKVHSDVVNDIIGASKEGKKAKKESKSKSSPIKNFSEQFMKSSYGEPKSSTPFRAR